MKFPVGSLVKARGREWVVQPGSDDNLIMVRPLGGMDDEVTGILTSLEKVASSQFDLPDPSHIGDHRSCRLLLDAVRLSSRSGAGPFRSFARIAVEPRPYQLVPLLMGLKLDPIRLLIADDVGIGKSVEALLVARELLDRGEVQRSAVLCPPHLAEQWQDELRDKFHIEAELVLPSTVSKLERRCGIGQSLFEIYPHVIVSMDYIKSDRRRDEFARTCPELVVVDEVHTCAFGMETRGRHQRHQLVRQLAADPNRHLILVTATPHSGREEAFRSLLTFLNQDFAQLPSDLTGAHNEPHRRRLAKHFVQRRRADLEHYLKTDTPFPTREEAEEHYKLTPEYHRLFDKVLEYARETVSENGEGRHRQRIRWWSALALLRSLASSPAAAAATLRNRAPAADTEDIEEADEIGRRTVLDIDLEDLEANDIAPGGDAGGETETDSALRTRLSRLAREADSFRGEKDAKLIKAVGFIKGFLKDGFSPIIFCRFIPTAEYVAEELRKRLPKDVDVQAVTGLLPPADREERVISLGTSPKRVLVATDCLSEGINLQDHFDAVMHYDLSWNPTRHEQREGRVDRFGQPRDVVRMLTYYGIDNMIDGIVLDVLIKKHKKIRSSLGISVPVPVNTDSIIEAVFEGLLFRERAGSKQDFLPGFEEYFRPKREDFFTKWENAADKEKRSRSMFAQETIKVEEVARELQETQVAIGSAKTVKTFTLDALKAYQGVITSQRDKFKFDLRETPRALRDAIATNHNEVFEGRFELPVGNNIIYLSRTHPIIEGLASFVMEAALDPKAQAIARRAGAIKTNFVSCRTTLLLIRFRFDVLTCREDQESPQLVEDCCLLAFEGAPNKAVWLDDQATQNLLEATPAANIDFEHASTFVERVIEGLEFLRPKIDAVAQDRAEALLQAHQRVRQAARVKGESYRVKPHLPADILGIYLCLPGAS